MRLWVDVVTPKAARVLWALLDYVREAELLVTTRQYREVESLLHMLGIEAEVVGKHGGGSLEGKLLAYADRVKALAKIALRFEPEASFPIQSVEASRVSFGLGIPFVLMNDSPHAEAVARLTVPLARYLYTPFCIPKRAWTRFGIAAERIVQYRCIDPAIWIRKGPVDRALATAIPEDLILVVMREEEYQAHYLAGVGRSPLEEVLYALSKLDLRDQLFVFYICRYKARPRIRKPRGLRVVFSRPGVDSIALLQRASLFVGAGGTMTWEAALMGVPSIDVFPGARTYVGRYMNRRKLVLSVRRVTPSLLKRLLSEETRMIWKRRASTILRSFENPLPQIVKRLEELAEEGRALRSSV